MIVTRLACGRRTGLPSKGATLLAGCFGSTLLESSAGARVEICRHETVLPSTNFSGIAMYSPKLHNT